jgi:hypothetical protein
MTATTFASLFEEERAEAACRERMDAYQRKCEREDNEVDPYDDLPADTTWVNPAAEYLTDPDKARRYVLSRLSSDVHGIISEMAKYWKTTVQPMDLYTMIREDGGSTGGVAMCCKLYGTSSALFINEDGRREWSFVTAGGDYFDVETDACIVAYLLASYW